MNACFAFVGKHLETPIPVVHKFNPTQLNSIHGPSHRRRLVLILLVAWTLTHLLEAVHGADLHFVRSWRCVRAGFSVGGSFFHVMSGGWILGLGRDVMVGAICARDVASSSSSSSSYDLRRGF